MRGAAAKPFSQRRDAESAEARREVLSSFLCVSFASSAPLRCSNGHVRVLNQQPTMGSTYTPGVSQLTDVRLQKNFPLRWEKSRLEFQAECFNLLNKTNFRSPNSSRSSSNFGTITSAFPPRIMQFALRFAF
jgi:hypothetical protein